MTVEGQKSSEEGVLMNRRTLIKTAIGAGLLAGVGSSGRSSVAVEPDARPKGLSGMLKLSSQDGRIPGKLSLIHI